MEKCHDEGFATFSAYLAHLIRLDRTHDEEKQIALGKSSSSTSAYPPARREFSTAEDRPATKKKTGT